jgi:Rps23 Pro-64 3,4-dihydroxylase Tpa1-like proline 4-hydroxylase
MTSSSPYSRTEIADHVAARLEKAAEALSAQFHLPGRIASCVVDEVLPDAMARRIHAAFPPTGRMMFKNSIKERKYVAAQMDAYDPILEEAVYAFQDPRVVALVSKITGLSAMEADAELYAGGISAMPRGAYLKPHLDNSHDKARERYRVLNLLYYVTPDWDPANGGNLQLWDQGPRGPSRTLESRFNTLVLMITGRQSWHSVNEVTADQSRCCVSNYYFSRARIISMRRHSAASRASPWPIRSCAPTTPCERRCLRFWATSYITTPMSIAVGRPQSRPQMFNGTRITRCAPCP